MAEQQGSGETTIIGSDSHFKGELSFERTAKLNGRFDGQIDGKGELQVSDSAQCQADVSAGSVQVDGRIEGNLNIKDTVRLNAKGVLKGDLVAAKMVMAEGASFVGHCAVGPEASKEAPAQQGGAGARPGRAGGEQGGTGGSSSGASGSAGGGQASQGGGESSRR